MDMHVRVEKDPIRPAIVETATIPKKNETPSRPSPFHPDFEDTGDYVVVWGVEGDDGPDAVNTSFSVHVNTMQASL
jgi:hypothetical protein